MLLPKNIQRKHATRFSTAVDISQKLLAMVLCSALVTWAQGNSFERVRYNGGSVDSKVSPHEWHNRLIVTSEVITLELHDGARLDIPAKSVTSLSYGQEAHRRVGTMVALAILVAPVALFGLFAKTRLHFIGMEYTTPDKKSAGILLQGDKDNYRAILVALQGVTGVPVAVGEKERGFVPVGVRTDVSKSQDTESQAKANGAGAPKESTQTQLSPPSASVSINSMPAGAEIYIDEDFSGNTPSTISVPPGKHVVSVRKSGFQDWVRTVSVSGGSITLAAELIAGTNRPSTASAAAPAPNKDSYMVTEGKSVALQSAESRKAQGTTSANVSEGWIGVSAKHFGSGGAVITAVVTGGPAAQAGLRAGDVINEVNGISLKDEDLDQKIAVCKPGTKVRIGYMRGAWAQEATVTVGTNAQ
jgi:hypothetical protein